MPLRHLAASLAAGRLGVDREVGRALVDDVAATRSRRDLLARTAAFAVASSPVGRVLPSSARRRALEAFLVPLLNHPRAANRFAGGREPRVDACAGLVRAE